MNILQELTAAAERGRAEIAEQRRRNEEAAIEWQREQDERNQERIASFLPVWMHDYVTVNDDEDGTVTITLPGHAPITVTQRGNSIGRAWLREPIGVEYSDYYKEWYVNTDPHLMFDWSLDALIALASDLGESYWTMRTEVDRRNAEGVKPQTVKPETSKPGVPDPLERIVLVLERIANQLEGGAIYIRNADTI